MKMNKILYIVIIFSMHCVKASNVAPSRPHFSPDFSKMVTEDLILVGFTNKSSKEITLAGIARAVRNIRLPVNESKDIILSYSVGSSPDIPGVLFEWSQDPIVHFEWSQEVGGQMKKYSGSTAVETNKSTGGLVPIMIAIKDDGKYEKL